MLVITEVLVVQVVVVHKRVLAVLQLAGKEMLAVLEVVLELLEAVEVLVQLVRLVAVAQAVMVVLVQLLVFQEVL
jgi:hypothetical protein